MKAFRIAIALVGLLWNTGAWAQGFDEVLITRHNLAVGGSDSMIHEVCRICHIERMADIVPRFEATPRPVPVPLPKVAEPAPPPEKTKITLSDKVAFEFDRFALKVAAEDVLRKIADTLKENPGLKVTVLGHTDNVGSAAYNRKLSKQRAEAIMRQLIQEGIEPERLNAKGLGYSFPLVSNDTEEGRARNRRVDLIISSPVSSTIPAPMKEEPLLSPAQPEEMEEEPVLFAEEPTKGSTEMPRPLSELEEDITPLWNSRNTVEVFLPLPKARSSLRRGQPDHRPFGPSFKCLACHDGALGDDIHERGFSSDPGRERMNEGAESNGDGSSKNHPDSIIYPRKVTGEFVAHRANPNLTRYWSIPDRDENGMMMPTGPRSINLGLRDVSSDDDQEPSRLVRTFLGVVHCDTCHNPHINQYRPFLRTSSKDLCLVCHQR